MNSNANTNTNSDSNSIRSRLITIAILVLVLSSTVGVGLLGSAAVVSAQSENETGENVTGDVADDVEEESDETDTDDSDDSDSGSGGGILPGDPTDITGTGTDAIAGGENETGGDENESVDADAEDEEEDDGGILSGIGDMAPSWDPEKWGEGTAEWLREWLFKGYSFLVNDIINELLGTPRMVNDGYNGVFGFPVEDPDVPTSILYAELFDEVLVPYVVPVIGGFLGFLLLAATVGPAISAVGAGTKNQFLLAAGAVALGLVAYWDFVSFLHNMSHYVTQMFLPDATDILDSDMALESGPTAAVVGMLLFGWSKGVILTAMLSFRYAALLAAPFSFPFFLVMAYGGMFKTVKMIGSFAIWQYYGLLVMPWPIAFLLRIALAIDFSSLFPETYLGQEIADFLTMATTIGFWLGAFFIPFLVMGTFGVASFLGRGMFVAKVAGGVSRLKGGVSSGSGGSTAPLGGSTGAKRAAAYNRAQNKGTSANASRQSVAAARADGGWNSRKLANGPKSDSATGSPLRRAGGRDSARRRRGAGTDRSTLQNVRNSERERGVVDSGGNARHRPTADDRRRAAHEKARMKRSNKGRSGRYGNDGSRTR